jgi:hypothetical protein
MRQKTLFSHILQKIWKRSHTLVTGIVPISSGNNKRKNIITVLDGWQWTNEACFIYLEESCIERGRTLHLLVPWCGIITMAWVEVGRATIVESCCYGYAFGGWRGLGDGYLQWGWEWEQAACSVLAGRARARRRPCAPHHRRTTRRRCVWELRTRWGTDCLGDDELGEGGERRRSVMENHQSTAYCCVGQSFDHRTSQCRCQAQPIQFGWTREGEREHGSHM